MYLPPEDLKEWVKLFSEALLGVAALVTAGTAIYGVRMWKHELAGREIYAAAKTLVKESHLLSRAVDRARRPIQDFERRVFSSKEIQHTTETERRRLAESEAFRGRIDEIAEADARFRSALLETRVLVGSKAFLWFLPFNEAVGDVIQRINDYLDLLQKHPPDSSEVKAAQKALYASANSDDELSQKIGNARENGEKALLAFLNRKSIRG